MQLPNRLTTKSTVSLFMIVLAAMLLSTSISAQTTSGEINGRVLDASGAIVPGAQVTLSNEETGAQQTGKTNASGLFVFPSLQPGTFAVSVQSAGFKTFEKRDMHLTASQRLSTGDLKLEVGAATQTVNVEAAPNPVQTETGDRSALLDNNELENLSTPGRDALAWSGCCLVW